MSAIRRRKQREAQVAERVFIPAAVMKQFPPMTGVQIGKEIVKMLRDCGVMFDEIRNWTRADHRIGYWIYYIGEPATKVVQLKLTTWQR
jgi:hypothetical protein